MLVVGASATGVQLADELARAGRAVVLAVGGHTRLPRRYRGMDIFWWLERIGSLDRTIDEVPDPHAARHEPSLQLVGRPDHRDLDLGHAPAARCRAHRPAHRHRRHRVGFAPDLPATVAEPTLACVESSPRSTPTSTPPASPPRSSTPNPHRPRRRHAPERLDLTRRGITSVIWATGHRRTYPWLHLPVLDERRGEIRQRRGVTPVPGLYVLGQRFQHTRSSNFIDGVGRDAAFVADHLGRTAPSPAAEGAPPMHPDRPHYDVVVVGARAAGAATAMLLARAGLRVLVVDRSRYGADTLSTHALMRGGVLQLQRWGLLDRIIDAGTPAIRRTTFRYADDDVAVTIKPSHGVDALYAPAARCSTRSSSTPPSRQVPTSATGHRHRPAPRPPRPGGRRRRPRRRPSRAVDAGLVIGADGLRSIVARLVGGLTEWRGAGASAVVYGYWSDIDDRLATSGSSAARVRRPHPDQRRRHLRLRRLDAGPHRPWRPDVHRRSRRASPEAAARLAHAAARRRAGATSPAVPGTSAERGDPAGRSSVTPAPGRTRSAPTASPTPSVTPSCSPGWCVPRDRAR